MSEKSDNVLMAYLRRTNQHQESIEETLLEQTRRMSRIESEILQRVQPTLAGIQAEIQRQDERIRSFRTDVRGIQSKIDTQITIGQIVAVIFGVNLVMIAIGLGITVAFHHYIITNISV